MLKLPTFDRQSCLSFLRRRAAKVMWFIWELRAGPQEGQNANTTWTFPLLVKRLRHWSSGVFQVVPSMVLLQWFGLSWQMLSCPHYVRTWRSFVETTTYQRENSMEAYLAELPTYGEEPPPSKHCPDFLVAPVEGHKRHNFHGYRKYFPLHCHTANTKTQDFPGWVDWLDHKTSWDGVYSEDDQERTLTISSVEAEREKVVEPRIPYSYKIKYRSFQCSLSKEEDCETKQKCTQTIFPF